MMLKVINGDKKPRKAPKPPREFKELQRPCEIIQAALKVRGITRVHLAKETGLSIGIVGPVVSGNRTCDDVADELERALNIPTGRLLEMERALGRQAQEKYSDLIDRLRDETRDLARDSFARRRLSLVKR